MISLSMDEAIVIATLDRPVPFAFGAALGGLVAEAKTVSMAAKPV